MGATIAQWIRLHLPSCRPQVRDPSTQSTLEPIIDCQICAILFK